MTLSNVIIVNSMNLTLTQLASVALLFVNVKLFLFRLCEDLLKIQTCLFYTCKFFMKFQHVFITITESEMPAVECVFCDFKDACHETASNDGCSVAGDAVERGVGG